MNLPELLFVVGVGAGPFIGFYLMLRRPDHARWQLVLSAALGAGLPVLIAVAGVGGEHGSPGLMVYVLLAMAYGAFVGACGVLARSLGAWLSRRQP